MGTTTPDRNPVTTILGREPAAYLALVAVIVKLAVAFGAHVTVDQQSAINAFAAAIIGVIIARIAHDGGIAAVLGLFQAAIALAVGYGLHWSADLQALVMSAVAIAAALYTRTQITAPVAPPAPAAVTYTRSE
jgi:hypothetical protein